MFWSAQLANGPIMKEVKTRSTHCIHQFKNSFKIGNYGGIPEIMSKVCPRKADYTEKDRG